MFDGRAITPPVPRCQGQQRHPFRRCGYYFGLQLIRARESLGVKDSLWSGVINDIWTRIANITPDHAPLPPDEQPVSRRSGRTACLMAIERSGVFLDRVLDGAAGP